MLKDDGDMMKSGAEVKRMSENESVLVRFKRGFLERGEANF